MTSLADTWLWTATGWTPTAAVGPLARSGAALAFDASAGVAVLFGGETTGPGPAPAKLLADTWAWNGQAWQQLAPHSSPPARDQAVIASDELTGGLVLFGGSGVRGDLSDTWLWDGETWSAARPAGSLSPRIRAASAFDAATQKLLVFGGVGPERRHPRRHRDALRSRPGGSRRGRHQRLTTIDRCSEYRPRLRAGRQFRPRWLAGDLIRLPAARPCRPGAGARIRSPTASAAQRRPGDSDR